MAKRHSGPRRYAIYLRCSSDDQAQGDFTTIDVQRTYNTEYVLAQGGVLYKEYVDEGKTGTNIKRPGFEALIRDAREGLFDMVIVTYMSRLARGEAYHVAEFLLKQENIGIELVREKFTADLAGHIGKQMTILMDGMYPKMVSQWTRAKQEQMVKCGYFCGGRVPFGYQKVEVLDAGMVSRNDKEPPKRLAPDAETTPFVVRAFEVFAETHSFNRVVDYLRSVTDRQWTLDDVTYMLRSDVYRGVLRYGQNVNLTAYEPIIAQELWNAVRTAEQDRPRSAKIDPVDTLPYYLRGLVYCAHCGCRMTPAGHHGMNAKIGYYECLDAKKKGTHLCPTYRVNAKALHGALLKEIARCGKYPTRIAKYIQEAAKLAPKDTEISRQLQAVTRRLRDIEKRIAQVTRAIEQGGGALRSLVERLQTLEQQRMTAEAERLALERKQAAQKRERPDEKQIQVRWARLMELWEFLTEDERCNAMQGLIERVDIRSKTEGTCRIRISGQVPISNVELSRNYRAGSLSSYT